MLGNNVGTNVTSSVNLGAAIFLSYAVGGLSTEQAVERSCNCP